MRTLSWSRGLAVAALLALGISGCGGDGGNSGDAGPSAREREMFAQSRSELEQLVTDLGVPGLGVAVILDGKIAFTDALGVRSVATGEPLTPRTTVLTGSILVKPLVAAVLVQLAAEGRVDLHRPALELLPWLPLTPMTEGATLHDGLTMRSGLLHSGMPECPDPSLRAALTNEHLYSFAAPGELFIYSGAGYPIGAAVIEELEQRPFVEVLREQMLLPMKMTDATFDSELAMGGDYAASHVIAEDGSVKVYEPTSLPSCAAGADCSRCDEVRANQALHASTEGVARFVKALLLSEPPLGEATVAALTAAHTNPGFGEGYGYGYGVFSLDVRGEHFLFATTSIDGVAGAAVWIPERRFGAVLLANGERADDNSLVMRSLQLEAVEIATRFLGLEGELPDLTTPPNTWDKYAGRFAADRPRYRTDTYDVTQSADGSLRVRNVAWPEGQSAEMTQGAAPGIDYWAYTAGDVFHFFDEGAHAYRQFNYFEGLGEGGMEIVWSLGENLVLRRIAQP